MIYEKSMAFNLLRELSTYICIFSCFKFIYEGLTNIKNEEIHTFINT